MSQDGTSALAIDAIEDMSGGKVFDKDKVAMVMDHSCPSPLEGVSAIHDKMRKFGEKTGITIYDWGCGVCHQLVPESGKIVCGDLVVGCDSHTCTYGALNVFSTGVGSTDGAAAMIAGKLWFRVPETIRINFNGQLAPGVFSKDMILYLAGILSADGATYKALEFHGEAIEALSVDARMTISNMAIEVGAKAGLMEADQKTLDFFAAHSERSPEPVFADEDATYCRVIDIDVSELIPQISKPHSVDNVSPIDELVGTPVAQGYIGTCTNGRVEDLAIAASILAGKKINPKCRLVVAPASRPIYLEAMEQGYIQQLVEAGACIVTPGCGPCVGTHNGVPSDGENVISTANRNFKGRMGNSNAFIYLGSPATVAVSMIEGQIADPRGYIG